MAAGVTFTAKGAERIRRAVAKALREDRGGDRTPSTTTEDGFWGLITGLSPDGNRYTLIRVYPTANTDSGADFKLTNGPSYRIFGEEPESGYARELNGNRYVPTYTVVWVRFIGYDAADEPSFLFQYVGPDDNVYLPPHDHRDNYNGGFSFAVFHPGTGLPQQPWAQ